MQLNTFLRIAMPSVLTLTLLCTGVLEAASPEPHAALLLEELVALRSAIRATPEDRDVSLVTVWDFDGTILDGDCTDNYVRDGSTVYRGLVPLAIEAGLSDIYPPASGADAFWAEYETLDETFGHWLAYPLIIQIFRGAPVDKLASVAERAFEEQLKPYYFASSMSLIRGLQAEGIEVWVISASPQHFVRAAAASLGIDPADIHGIRVVESGGRLTEQLVYPVTVGNGKRERLGELLQERQRSNRTFVIGGFGNSFNSDGPFLSWIAGQQLAAGTPIAVMINGGEAPPAYAGRFREVKQSAVVGE